MSDYDWVVSVRIVRDHVDPSEAFPGGWSRCVVDAPTFWLRSDPQFGSIYSSANSALRAVHTMFGSLLGRDDTLYAAVANGSGESAHGHFHAAVSV